MAQIFSKSSVSLGSDLEKIVLSLSHGSKIGNNIPRAMAQNLGSGSGVAQEKEYSYGSAPLRPGCRQTEIVGLYFRYEGPL